ncbi:MAG: PEP-CTERM sorting domain-containing protein [Planctomycetota bacterium]|jgi:hypothetical protein
MWIDNVSVQLVPEPGTLLLLVFGAVMVKKKGINF